MKNRHYLRHILAITALLFNGEAIYSQTYPIENYLKAAGDYVTIYNGEIELTYSLAQYDNLPYFQGDEFTLSLIHISSLFSGCSMADINYVIRYS